MKSFENYRKQRNEAFDILGRLKRGVGVQDAKGKTSLDTHAMLQAGSGTAALAGGASKVLAQTAKVAGHIATGNVLGASFSVWNWIKAVAEAGGGLKSFSSAGLLINQIKSHKTGLEEYLKSKEIPQATITKIVDSIFEIDGETVEDIPPGVWSSTTAEFIKRLSSGYDNIETKILASIVHEKLIEWLKKFGGHSEELENSVRELMKEKLAKVKTLETSRIEDVIASYHPEGNSRGEEAARQHSETKIPKDGDKAYTVKGYRIVGTLQNIRPKSGGEKGYVGHLIYNSNLSGDSKPRTLFVGYDEPIEWDSEENMWHAPADYD